MDDKCFRYAATAGLNNEKLNYPERVTNIEMFIEIYN